MFYTKGLPFHFAINPYYVRAFKSASQLPGYVSPGYNTLKLRSCRRRRVILRIY